MQALNHFMIPQVDFCFPGLIVSPIVSEKRVVGTNCSVSEHQVAMGNPPTQFILSLVVAEEYTKVEGLCYSAVL